MGFGDGEIGSSGEDSLSDSYITALEGIVLATL
jgi:hypothetical protein